MKTIELIKKPKQHTHIEPSLYEFNIFSLCVETGALIFSCFMAYFLIMRAIGLHEVFKLRYLNVLFLVSGILLAINSYRKNSKSNISYKKGLQMGTFITLIAVLPFAVFIFLYLNIDDGFLGLVEKDVELREFVSPLTVACFICLEGLCSGSIVTFIVMQYFKRKQRKLNVL